MFVAITATLTLYLLMSVESTPNDLYNSADNIALAANIYDDVILKNLEQRMITLQISNDNLRLKMDSLILSFEQLLTKQNMELQKNFEDLKSISLTSKEQCPSEKSENTNFPNKSQEIDQITALKPNETLPKNCAEALEKNIHSGLYKIKVSNSELTPFYVYCLSHIGSELEKAATSSNTSPWLVIQRRKDGSVDFHRNWDDYLNGFGNLEGEFFIGLHKLYALTQSTLHELWIQIEDYYANRRWAKYSTFAIGGADESFSLNILGNFTGDCGDSLSMHIGSKWTTKDVDNDQHAKNCATLYKGAWWYTSCNHSNLNGEYGSNAWGKGINWFTWNGADYSLKYVHMAIRPIG